MSSLRRTFRRLRKISASLTDSVSKGSGSAQIKNGHFRNPNQEQNNQQQ